VLKSKWRKAAPWSWAPDLLRWRLWGMRGVMFQKLESSETLPWGLQSTRESIFGLQSHTQRELSDF
jgi:hypothetical protein